mgnify:CR=1 FL=1
MIEVSHLTKKYGSRLAVEDVSFAVADGGICGLLGPNGAGKSTIMNILTGYLSATSGQVTVAGHPLPEEADAAKMCVGYLPEQPPLYPEMTVQEYLDFAAELKGVKKAERKEQVRSAARRTGLEKVLPRLIRSLSKGYRQRVGIAQALLGSPKLIILDEPTAVLTEKEAEALLDSIRSMSEKGIAVIFITHRLHEILSVCDTVVVMRDGYVVKNVPAKDTNVSDITKWMVGRNVSSAANNDIRALPDAKTIMSIRKLWVDMPGEIVRNVDLDIKEGEILGIGGLAGQGKLGIPNGVMGLYEAGGTVEFEGKPIPLNSPRSCLDANIAFVSEDRRGVGLLLDETLEWSVAFPAMQVQDKFLKKLLGGLIKWRKGHRRSHR